jgi:aminotransferase EvaB
MACLIETHGWSLVTTQAIVGKHVLNGLDDTNLKRRSNARRYIEFWRDAEFEGAEVEVPYRPWWDKNGMTSEHGPVFHLFQIQATKRDELVKHLNSNGIEAKVHYPVPLHLQPALSEFGWQAGDFPEVEAWCDRTVSLPVHEFLNDDQIEFTAQTVMDFYR